MQNKLYDFDVVTIKKYSDDNYRVTWNKSMRIKGQENVSDSECDTPHNIQNLSRETLTQKEKYVKFSESLIRAKSTVRDYILCNDFTFFVTLTCNPDKFRDRYDVKTTADKITQTISDYNKRQGKVKGFKVIYVLIPEKHPTSGAIHFHGFMTLPEDELRTNKNGYKEWGIYADKCGYMSISKIRDINKAASYITKYMAKDLMSTTLSDRGSHAYYCSRGLKKPELFFQGHAKILPGTEWDWIHPDGFCAVKNVTLAGLKVFVDTRFFQEYKVLKHFRKVEFTPFDPEFIDVKILYENKKTIYKLRSIRYTRKCNGDVPRMNYITYNRRKRK